MEFFLNVSPNSLNSLNSMEVLFHLGKTPMYSLKELDDHEMSESAFRTAAVPGERVGQGITIDR